MFVPTPEHVCAVNKCVTGAQHQILDLDKIESAVSRIRFHQKYGTAGILELTAVLMAGIAQAHGFLDGNMRTAFIVALDFAYENGVHFQINDTLEIAQELEAAMIGKKTFQELAEMLRQHVV